MNRKSRALLSELSFTPFLWQAGEVNNSKPAADGAIRGARARVRSDLMRQITEVARVHLGKSGASGLSVRAITRELGMASSAVYRYFPSRDALLTELIIEAYEAIGHAAQVAEEECDRHDFLGRWCSVFGAVRAWAREHPHEYALIYGSPVPGYAAPMDTAAPASRVALLLATIAAEAQLDHTASAVESTPELELREISPELQADVESRIEDLVAISAPENSETLRAIAPSLVIAIIESWTELFGSVSFELFGHYHNVIEARDAYFAEIALRTAKAVGIESD